MFSFVKLFVGYTQQEKALFRKIFFIISLLRNKVNLDVHYKDITKKLIKVSMKSGGWALGSQLYPTSVKSCARNDELTRSTLWGAFAGWGV